MGSDDGFFPEDREGPTWKVQVSPFRIGKHEVSNRRFKAFVKATG
jgi:sulfatase modifying factor 1